MSRYRLSPLARGDLDAIWDYIGVEHDRPAAAHRLVEALFERFAMLARHPLAGQARADLADVAKDVRSFSLGNYVIYYQPVSDGVRIARVLHGARDARAALGSEPAGR
jgi:toxin ParE1/3/4